MTLSLKETNSPHIENKEVQLVPTDGLIPKDLVIIPGAGSYSILYQKI